MDIDATLATIRTIIREWETDSYTGTDWTARLEWALENMQALDEWMSRGGCKPEDWTC